MSKQQGKCKERQRRAGLNREEKNIMEIEGKTILVEINKCNSRDEAELECSHARTHPNTDIPEIFPENNHRKIYHHIYL